MRKLSVICGASLVSTCTLNLTVVSRLDNAQALSGIQMRSPTALIFPVSSDAVLSARVNQAVHLGPKLIPREPGESILLPENENASSIAHGLSMTHVSIGDALNFEHLPEFITFFPETFSEQDKMTTGFSVPPLHFPTTDSDITFQTEELAVIEGGYGQHSTTENIARPPFKQIPLAPPEGFRRENLEISIKPNGDMTTQPELERRDILESFSNVAPGGRKYWLEDPDSIWW